MQNNLDIEDQRKSCCPRFTLPCWKFAIAAFISLGTTVLASFFLIKDNFKNTALTSFSVGLISSNLAYWTDPPKFKEN